MADIPTRQQLWRRNNPRRYQAHLAVGRLKRKGLLTPQPCEVCGAERAEAHHPDYDRPSLVSWLCRRHHVQLHRREGGT